MIVKNYTGDRLNFGIAVEQAKAEGIQCDMLIVADDCAVVERDEDKIAGRRGIAGTVLVHKAAGAIAAAGAPLQQVVAVAKATEASIGSVGVALDVCSLPGQPKNERIPLDFVELGLGIHGEPGTQLVALQPANRLVDRMLTMIYDQNSGACCWPEPLSAGERVILLVNNLGSTPAMELYVVARQAIASLESKGLQVDRVLVGSFMTSLDMTGVSLTLLKVDAFTQRLTQEIMHRPSASLYPGWVEVPDITSLLDKRVGAVAWPANGFGNRTVAKSMPVPRSAASISQDSQDISTPSVGGLQSDIVREAIVSACQDIIAAESQLTEWDSIAGDGDCGLTMKRGAEKVLSDLDTYQLANPACLLGQLADSIGTMGGTSGAILSIFFRACGNSLAQAASADGSAVVAATQAGCDAITFYGGAKPGMRTMLDSLAPAVLSGAEVVAMAQDSCAVSVIQAMATGAMTGAKDTCSMAAVAGRAAYVPDKQVQGTPDPGAMAIAIALNAVAKALR